MSRQPKMYRHYIYLTLDVAWFTLMKIRLYLDLDRVS